MKVFALADGTGKAEEKRKFMADHPEEGLGRASERQRRYMQVLGNCRCGSLALALRISDSGVAGVI